MRCFALRGQRCLQALHALLCADSQVMGTLPFTALRLIQVTRGRHGNAVNLPGSGFRSWVHAVKCCKDQIQRWPSSSLRQARPPCTAGRPSWDSPKPLSLHRKNRQERRAVPLRVDVHPLRRRSCGGRHRSLPGLGGTFSPLEVEGIARSESFGAFGAGSGLSFFGSRRLLAARHI